MKPFQRETIIVYLILSSVIIYGVTQYTPSEENNLKSTLVRESLRIGFYDGRLPDSHFLINDSIIYVSSENIEDIKLPDDLGLNFLKTSPKHLQEIADQNGNFMYIYFNEVSDRNPYVEVMTRFKLASGSPHMYLAGGCMGVSFNYNGTHWEGSVVKLWIS